MDSKPRILLVDDEADFRFSASVALRRAGCEVVEAADGREAISRFQEFRRAGGGFDLLLTDFRMPYLTGVGLLKAMRGLGIDIPVIAITGYCEDVLRADLMDMGCTEFMEKPFEPDDLVKRVWEVLRSFALQGDGI